MKASKEAFVHRHRTSKAHRLKRRHTIAASSRKVRRSDWLLLGAFILSATVVAYFVLGRQPILRIDPTDAALVERGRRTYVEACASCHGASLEGQPNWQRRMANGRLPAPPHDVSGHTWHHSDEWLFKITKYGPTAYPDGYQTDMPAFEQRLSDEDIAASLAFIKSTWPAEVRIKQARITYDSQSRR